MKELFACLPATAVRNHLSCYLDPQSTSAAMLSCRTLYSLFTANVMPYWRKKLGDEFQIPKHITESLLSPHLVYQRLVKLANNPTHDSRKLLKKIRFEHCSPDNSAFDAAWLLYPYTPDAEQAFQAIILPQRLDFMMRELLNKAIRVNNHALVQYLLKVVQVKPNNDSLLNAAASGNLALVVYLITEHGLKPNNDTLLNAGNSGNLELVEYLITEHGLNAQYVPQGGSGLLYSAALSGDPALITTLITQYRLHPTTSTLYAAAHSCNLVQTLIRKYDLRPDWNTLRGAAEVGNLALVKVLITDYQLRPDRAMLSGATNSGNKDLVLYLILEHQLTPDAEILDNAANSGNLLLVQYLITDHKLTPTSNTLRNAAYSGNSEMVKYLITEHPLLQLPDALETVDIVCKHVNKATVQYIQALLQSLSAGTGSNLDK